MEYVEELKGHSENIFKRLLGVINREFQRILLKKYWSFHTTILKSKKNTPQAIEEEDPKGDKMGIQWIF